MIYSCSLLTTLCLLVALLARPAAARAEPEATPSPTPAAAESAPALPVVHETGPPLPASAEPPATATSPTPATFTETPVPVAAPAPPAPATPAAEPPAAATPPPAPHAPAELPRPDAREMRIQIASLQKLGLSLTEREDWAAAEISFRQILALRAATADDLANALIGLARVYRRQGALTKAAAIYERFLKDYPTDGQAPDALLELGRTHRALGAHQLALARFYSVINSTLKVSGEGFIHYQMLAKTAQFEIAETHFQQGEFAEANKFFSRLRLLDLAPADRARAHFKSAYALYLDKNYESAVTTLHSYLEQWAQDENVPEARYLLALSLRTLGRKQEALDATLQLLRSAQSATDPKRWGYWQRRTGNQLANDFFQNGDTLNALAIYQGLATLAPEPAWRLPVTYQLALCHERLRDSERAAAAYQTIIDTAADPANAVSSELKELARMATWRLGQLTWQTQTDQQLANLFDLGPKKVVPTLAAVPPGATPHPIPSDTPANDHSGNPAKAPPSL